MKISAEFLRIQAAEVDAVGGAKPEPEARPLERVQAGAIETNFNDGRLTGGALRGATLIETTVGQFAQGIRRMCGSCRYMNREAWRHMHAAIEASEDILVRDELNGLRAHFLTSADSTLSDLHEGADGDLDVEHAIGSMGLCEAYTGYLKCPAGEEVIVHPAGVCPEKLGDLWPESPDANMALPMLYEPRSNAIQQAASAQYDRVMRAAKGLKDG